MSYFRGGMGDDQSDKPTAAESAASLAAARPTVVPEAPAPNIGDMFAALIGDVKNAFAPTTSQVGGALLTTNAELPKQSGGGMGLVLLGGIAIVGAVLLFRKATPAVNPRRRRYA